MFTVAETMDPVIARNGLSVNPDYSLADCPQPDLLLVPGGAGTRSRMHDAGLIDWIQRTVERADLVMSVCTGALLLAKAGLLDGLEATTHHVGFDLLREIAPTATVHEDVRFVDNGKIITSAGIAAGIDMSLHVVERLLGPDAAAETARHMEYPWKQESKRMTENTGTTGNDRSQIIGRYVSPCFPVSHGLGHRQRLRVQYTLVDGVVGLGDGPEAGDARAGPWMRPGNFVDLSGPGV